MVFPHFQRIRVLEEPVCIYLFRKNPVLNSLQLRSPVHVVPPPVSNTSTRLMILLIFSAAAERRDAGGAYHRERHRGLQLPGGGGTRRCRRSHPTQQRQVDFQLAYGLE